MKTRILLFFLLCGLVTQAQNIEVSGIQSGTWDADTVFVTDNVVIEDALNIMHGTTVVFDGFYNISVGENASLNVLGTRNDSIVFTVTDTTGFHVFNIGRGGWNGIRLVKAGVSRFEYCRFQYGKAALDNDQDGGALRIYHCDDVEINNSTLFCNFSREHGGALNAEYSSVTMRDCNVCNNLTYTGLDTVYFMYGGGLRFINCNVEIIGTNFRYNNGQAAIGGAMSLDSCAVLIDRCRFEYNYGINGGGLYLIRSNHNDCRISNSLFANNTSGHFGGGLAISDSSPLISNLTVANNHSIGVNCGGIFFYQYSSPVLWNCIVYGNTNEVPLEEPVQMWAWTYEEYAPEFHNCLVQFGLENISNHDVITVYENCLDEDPCFCDLENNDYHLAMGSPCIDVGSPETPNIILNGLDLDGNGRVDHNQIDLGAYEFSFTSVQETTQNENLVCIIGNPITASSYAEIVLNQKGLVMASIYSMEGKLLANKNLGFAEKGINHFEIGELFSSLCSGTYVIVFKAADQTFSTKVIK